MINNNPALRRSKISLAVLSLLATAAISGCNDDDSNNNSTVTPAKNEVVTPSDNVVVEPQVATPEAAPAPSAEQVSVSYVAKAPVARAVSATASNSYASWKLKCGENEYAPAHSDEFGPSWLVPASACGAISITDASDNEKASGTLEGKHKGQSVGLSDGASTTVKVLSRDALLMESYGLAQEGLDVKLKEFKAPGELTGPGSNEVAIQLYDPMGDNAPYAEMNLYVWNDSECTVVDPSWGDKGWDDVSLVPAASDAVGPVWHVPVTADKGCFKVIVRNKNKDKLISADLKIDVAALGDSRSVTLMPGSSTQYPSRDKAFELAGPSSEFKIDSLGALLIDANTLVWKGGKGADTVQIKFNSDGKYPVKDGVVSGPGIKLTANGELDNSKFPHLKGYPAFTLPALDENVSLKKLLKGSMVAIATTSEKDGEKTVNTLRSATAIQYAGALDAIYATDAKQLAYGPVYQNGEVAFRLWAPTASDVDLVIYDQNRFEKKRVQMTEDKASGAWSITLPQGDVDKQYYRYAMKVFQPREQKAYGYEVTDPYSVSLSTNSVFSQAVDLESDELKPAGWDNLQSPHSQKDAALSDMTIYESHVRDFSSMDASTENKGKYLAFTEQGTVPVEHLKQLSEAGMTHLHLLPVFDIATINEDPAKVANIDQPFSKLCQVNASVKNSAFKEYCDSGSTIAEVFDVLKESDGKKSTKVQDLNEYVRQVDSYNWGYDPLHYTVPEGSYASSAEGTTRILEFRKMVQSVKQDIGMNVVVDVVYNHTNAAGLAEKSVLDKVVPLYYQRLVADTGAVETSTCCSNTAPEHEMFAKLIDDSVKTWAKEYKIDAFRWDLMGHHPLAQMKGTLAAAREVNPEVYFYGEGWNFGEVENDKRFVQATQKHLGGTGIGSFSDRLRDAVRGGSPFDSGDGIRKTQGFANGAYVKPNKLVTVDADEKKRALHQADLVRLGMAANLKEFVFVDKDGNSQKGLTLDYNGQAAGYAEQPWEIQNYVSKHDNQTFWDNNMYKVAEDVTTENRVRMQSLGMATVLLGQGMPFNHQGGELLRSKSMQRDSYDYGDWYNKVDFTLNDNNWDKGLPAKDKDASNYDVIETVLKHSNADAQAQHMQVAFAQYKEMLKLRKSSDLMTLPSGAEIINRVDFRNTGAAQTPGLIVMSIDNGSTQKTDIDSDLDAMVVVINATPDSQSFNRFTDNNGALINLAGFELSDAHLSSDSIAGDASFTDSTFKVPAWSAAVFVQKRGSERGLGLPVSKKGEVPPFGHDTSVYVAGGFNGWTVDGTSAAFTTGSLYQATVTVEGATEYKFTLGDWSKANWGCGDGNCIIDAAGTYTLTLDASNPEAPVVLDPVKK